MQTYDVVFDAVEEFLRAVSAAGAARGVPVNRLGPRRTEPIPGTRDASAARKSVLFGFPRHQAMMNYFKDLMESGLFHRS